LDAQNGPSERLKMRLRRLKLYPLMMGKIRTEVAQKLKFDPATE